MLRFSSLCVCWFVVLVFFFPQSYLITNLIHLSVHVTSGSPDVQVRRNLLQHNSDFRLLRLAVAVPTLSSETQKTVKLYQQEIWIKFIVSTSSLAFSSLDL